VHQTGFRWPDDPIIRVRNRRVSRDVSEKKEVSDLSGKRQPSMPLKSRHLADSLLARMPWPLAMCQKQKVLALNSENPSKSYVVEIN
jgi:hypothetical protein